MELMQFKSVLADKAVVVQAPGQVVQIVASFLAVVQYHLPAMVVVRVLVMEGWLDLVVAQVVEVIGVHLDLMPAWLHRAMQLVLLAQYCMAKMEV